MPIYEYICELCGSTQEAFQGITEEPLKICSNCHKPGLTKLVSAAGFRLKGGGWYETDFKQGDKKKNLARNDELTPSTSKPKKDSGFDKSGSTTS